MAQEKPITFDENQIPVLFNQTVGKVTYVAQRNAKFEKDESGKRTDKVRALSVEVASEAQRETFIVDLPADFNLNGFSFGDTIEIEGVDIVEPWSLLPAGETNVRNAYSGFSVVATGIRKLAISNSQNQPQPENSTQKSKEIEKGKS